LLLQLPRPGTGSTRAQQSNKQEEPGPDSGATARAGRLAPSRPTGTALGTGLAPGPCRATGLSITPGNDRWNVVDVVVRHGEFSPHEFRQRLYIKHKKAGKIPGFSSAS
jgi:hypothetical protein